MRLADLLWLSLSALFQQKLRTLLTTLGVLSGSFVLVFSLSLGRGVQDTIVREYTRHAGLRQIDVRPNYQPNRSEQVVDKIEVKGTMSEEKRKRLRREIHLHEQQIAQPTTSVLLTPDRLQQLRDIPHVAAVIPVIDLHGRVILNGQGVDTFVHSAPSSHAHLRKRIVAGSFLASDAGDEVVVTEYLLYRLGVIDDAAVESIIGQKLRFEYRTGASKPHLLLMLFNASRSNVVQEEQNLLDKVVQQLPAALDRLDLSTAEKDFLRKTLQTPAGPSRRQDGVTISRECTIVGVLRSSLPDEPSERMDWWTQAVDAVLPMQTATGLFFEVPFNRENGLHRVMLEADTVDNVKSVTQAIAALGMQSDSLVEMIEREQFTYLLLFSAMTCIAVVAVIVAALGIINTMLMSVLERTREIGVMKAVGARNRHILTIFLVEGSLIGVVGGLFGLLAGWLFSLPSDAWMRSLVSERLKLDLKDPLFTWPVWLLFGVPMFACLVTTLAAVYPARRATQVNPITALRHE